MKARKQQRGAFAVTVAAALLVTSPAPPFAPLSSSP